jgi:hypothetical protein
MKAYINSNKVLVALVFIAIVLIILSLSGQFYKYLLFDGKDRYIIDKLSLDNEYNIPTWYSSILLLICSALTGLLFLLKIKEVDSSKFYWIGLSVIFFLLASDEMLVLHEQIISPLRNLLNTGGFLYMAWIIPAVLLGIFFLVAYYKFLFSLPRQTLIYFIVSGIIYVSGALGLEAISGKIITELGENTLEYSLVTQFEEILEISGVLLFIYALLQYYGLYYSEFSIQIVNKK